jgi:hypothetical protein
MASLCERRSRTPSDGKGIWVPRHEACRPPSCPVPVSEARRHAEARSRYVLPSELQVGRDPDGAVAPLWGEGEEKGGESRRRRERGERGGGGRRNGAEESGQRGERRGARAVRSRARRSRALLRTAERSESAPGAKARRAAESERGSRSGGDRGTAVAEHRRVSRACPWRQCACRRSAVSTAVRRRVARTGGRGRSARWPPTERSGAERRGGFPPCFYACARGRRGGRPERTEARRASCGRARRRPGASVPARGPCGCTRSGAEGAAGARVAASDGRRRDAPFRGKATARSVTGRESCTRAGRSQEA